MVAEAEVTKVGFELPVVSKEVTFDKVYAYSGRFGGPHLKTIHTDRGVAKELGFPDVVCQGTMIINYASEMLFNVYREHWVNSSKINVAFTKPVLPGDVITVKGVVKERQVVDSSIRVELEVWAENQKSEKVMAGEAVVTIEQ